MDDFIRIMEQMVTDVRDLPADKWGMRDKVCAAIEGDIREFEDCSKLRYIKPTINILRFEGVEN